MNSLKTYLTEAYAIDNNSILRILTQNKQINKADPDYTYYNKLAVWANEKGRQQKLKNIDLNTIKLSDRSLITKNKIITKHTTLGHVLLALKNLMDQEGKYTPNSELSNLIQQTTLEILAALSGIKNNKKLPEEPNNKSDEATAEETSNSARDEENTVEQSKEDGKDLEDNPEGDPDGGSVENSKDTTDNTPDAEKSSGSRDWTAYRAEKLAKVKPTAKALSEFYEEYYSVEYAGVKPEKKREIVAKLKSLDKILIPEFNKLGYNPEVNPFASFLKILIKNKFDIFEKLTYNTYGAIHNSFINRHITGNMLGQKFDETNILFCSDLYNKNGLDIVNYLDLQKQTLAAGKNSDIKNLIAKIFIQQDVEGETYDKKVNNLKELSNPVLPGADVAKLKSEPEIRELYRNLFGHEAKNKENDDLTKIVNETENDIILDMIYYLKSQYEAVLDDEDEAGIVKWLEDFNYTRNTTKIETSKEILSRYSKMRSAQTVLRLIGKLEAKKRKEAKK